MIQWVTMYLMKITWDIVKAELNIEKHEVTFDEAATVLISETAISFEDDQHDEERFITSHYFGKKSHSKGA